MSRTKSIILEKEEIIKEILNDLDLREAERKLQSSIPTPQNMSTEP
jgi:hypothetical protein